MAPVGSFHGRVRLLDTDEAGTFVYDPVPGEPLTFTRPNGEVVVLDESFPTDGATTPRFLRCVPWLDPWAAWHRAAVLHDWLWTLRYTGRARYSFWESNVILAEGCRAKGLAPWKCWAIRWAINLFGWWYWLTATADPVKPAQMVRP